MCFPKLIAEAVLPAEKALLILDVDGVIFDSNALKERNILQAASALCDSETAQSFCRYFTRNNGLPREAKIFGYFAGREALAGELLKKYNALNAEMLHDVAFTEGALEKIQALSHRFGLVGLSGGLETEVHELFAHKGLSQYFFHIRGGPLTKEANLRAFTDFEIALYVGDSEADFRAARAFGIPFCFMHGYTQFEGWESFLEAYPDVHVIRHLSELAV